ncbi:hypothetical protein CK203_084361 [Vitis vinifera]|uniref:Uncharacterized protein n=1 Tax=Vitis vinifera TaxID=29760 RepID=A0A438DF97_VITVI|nr:hypothetical protein CK203_084361 [Vitis vinifera]
MTTSVGSRALCTSPKGETTLFYYDMLDKSNFIVPKKILWNDVEFLENWHFVNVVPVIEQRSEMIEQIVQYPDGGGDLFFSNFFRYSNSPRVSIYEPSRASSSLSQNHTNVAKPFYIEENESTQESQQDESPVMSPTYSQMINTISLSDEDFEINKDLLRKDFYSEVNKPMNDWFFSIVPKVIRTIYQEEFYAYLRQEKKNIKFWIWFELFKQENIQIIPCTIYEWNIDGMTEYNILTKLQEMTMVSTTYKLNNRLPDHAVAQTIVVGFTVVKDEDGQDIKDVVVILIYSISKHFIGDPAKIKNKTTDLLTNLKCPKLHDFSWYKEVFLTKVMLRLDCNQPFWKEKFISGLPKLFFERIKIKIREQYNGQIPYDKLTYGEIISIVIAEGIKLCNDFKLKQQMKKEQKIYKNEFGSFCSQFGFNQKETMPLSKQKNK